jgi:hypothetical protein
LRGRKKRRRETVTDGTKALGWVRTVIREFQFKVFLTQTSRLVDELEFTDLLTQVSDLVLVLLWRRTRGTLPCGRIGVR